MLQIQLRAANCVEEEAWNLKVKQFRDSRQHEQIMKDESKAIKSGSKIKCDPEALVAIIKMIYQRKQKRLYKEKSALL